MLFRSFLTIILIGSMAALSSCEKGEEPIPPVVEPAKYTIKGQVLNQQTNQPLQGVAVKMGALTTSTSATGEFEFKDLTEAGKYTLTFTKEKFFNATYSLEFQAAEPNQIVSFNITVAMVPYVEGVTPINPSEGGTIDVVGDVPVTVTIPAGTTVTDASNQPVTGPINISAMQVPDIVTSDENYNPGLVTLQFGPAGLKFSKPLPIALANPFQSLRFEEMKLEYYNQSTMKWEVQAQPVTYAEGNKYNTTVNHFSLYKLSYSIRMSFLSALKEGINVIDTPIKNDGLTGKNVTSIKVKRKTGYIFLTPVETVIANAGITGEDAARLAKEAKAIGAALNGMATASSSFTEIEQEVAVDRVVQPNYQLVTTGDQRITRVQYSFVVQKFPDNNSKTTLTFEIHRADLVTLSFQDLPLDDHGHGDHGDHGNGGGGSL